LLRETVLFLWITACVVGALARPFFGALMILLHYVLKEVLIVETYGAFERYSCFEILYLATMAGVVVTQAHRLGDFMPRSMVDWGMLGFLMVMVASAMVNGVPVFDHKYIDLYFKATVLYFLVSRLADTPRRIIIVALCMVLATAYLVYLGWSKFRTGELSIARPYWFSSFHEFGLQIVITLPLLGALVLARIKPFLRALLFALIPLFVLVGMRSYSRSAYLGVGLGVVLLLWYYRHRWYVGFAAAPFIVYAFLHQPERVQARMQSIWSHKTALGTEDTSIAGRFEQMRTAMRVVAAHPLLGIGPRQFFLKYSQFVSAEDEKGVTYTMHSVPLLIMAEEGLLGFAVYYGLLVAGALRAARYAVRRARDDPELETVAVVAAGALMGYIAYIAYSLTQPAMWTINIYGTVALVEAARRVTAAYFHELAEAREPAEEPRSVWLPREPSTEVVFP